MRNDYEWSVISYDRERQLVVPYNVFENEKLCAELTHLFSIPDATLEELKDDLFEIVRQIFYCRCDYEVWVFGYPHSMRDDGDLIDIFDQLTINFDRFAEYVYNIYREYREERE